MHQIIYLFSLNNKFWLCIVRDILSRLGLEQTQLSWINVGFSRLKSNFNFNSNSNFNQNSAILRIYGEIFAKFGVIIAKSSKILAKSSESPSNMADLPWLVHATKFEPIWTDPIVRTP